MRRLLYISVLAVFSDSHDEVHANMLMWISGSATNPGVQEQPNLSSDGSDNRFYIWGRPEEGMTLANLELNVVLTNHSVLEFTDVEIINPLLGMMDFPPPPKDIRRFEYINDPNLENSPYAIVGFGGFSVTSAGPVGAGMGPDTASLDSGYDAAADAFHIATITYEMVGPAGSSTDIFLQIGPSGINNFGGTSSQLNVVFGIATDPPLNANGDRQVNSATFDARITVNGPVVPEPTTAALFLLGFVGMWAWTAAGRRKLGPAQE